MINTFFLGYQIGCQLREKRPAKVEKPAMYLYNGVRLPALPEWDKETYPYAVIAKLPVFEPPYYRVYYCTEECTVNDTKAIYLAPYIWYMMVGDAWEYKGVGTVTGEIIRAGVDPIWANHDVLHENGTIYLAASEPVPQ